MEKINHANQKKSEMATLIDKIGFRIKRKAGYNEKKTESPNIQFSMGMHNRAAKCVKQI